MKRAMDDRNQFMPAGPLDPVAAEIAAWFHADPVWQGLRTNPIAETRAAIRAATPLLGQPAMDVRDFRVAVADAEIGMRVYRPRPQPRAIIVWAHGGGFVLGSVDENDNFARVLASVSGCSVASIDYRLAPEHRFPTQVEDVLAAAQWVARRRTDLAGDVPLIVGGDSAGANLATVVTRKLHEANTVSISANVLAYPCTDSGETDSLCGFEPPFLTAQEIRWFQDQYLGDRGVRHHPDFAPIHADNLGLLPPTFLITAEHDIITAQAEIYGQAMEDAGVAVRIRRHSGMIHGFLTMDVFFQSAAGRAIGEVSDFVTDVLKG